MPRDWRQKRKFRPLFGWWAAAGGLVTAAFMHTPPFGVTLTPSPAGVAAALAEAFAGRGRFPAWVMADATAAASFAAAWERRTGQSARVVRRSRLFRLGRLLRPDPAPPGRARAGRGRGVDNTGDAVAVNDNSAVLQQFSGHHIEQQMRTDYRVPCAWQWSSCNDRKSQAHRAAATT